MQCNDCNGAIGLPATGNCSNCGAGIGRMSDGLCTKCSIELNECESCRKQLTDEDKDEFTTQ
jgi:hypothetical protein